MGLPFFPPGLPVTVRGKNVLPAWRQLAMRARTMLIFGQPSNRHHLHQADFRVILSMAPAWARVFSSPHYPRTHQFRALAF